MLRAKHGNTSVQLSCQVAKIRFEVGNRCFSQDEFVSSRLRLLDERFRRTHTKNLFRPVISSIRFTKVPRTWRQNSAAPTAVAASPASHHSTTPLCLRLAAR